MTNHARPSTAPNRLATQASPYLLQHAHNPVDWWPWSSDALSEARRRDVPILLSVGYATCYWCHVMERECFESAAIAELMNRHFVCIKLDREERPDLDEIYMSALVMTRGHGGWPMNAFLEPEKFRPFWIGTYFPPEPRGGMPSWTQVLESIADAWSKDRPGVHAQSQRIADAVREHLAAPAEEVRVGASQVEDALSQLLRSFDRVEGGFGKAPKFPQPSVLEFLLDVRALVEEGTTRGALDEAVRTTLDCMARGGIFDQVGAGFHRYSVDSSWTVPHFEKMLYDNAMLLSLYANASRIYGEPEYARIAKRTVEYLLREMRHADGGFFSAQDAEVHGREGLNYLWTPQEVRAAATAEDGDFACALYGLDTGPNFQDPHHPQDPPRNVLRLNDLPSRLAPEFRMTPAAMNERLDRTNSKLLEARSQREQPRLDDKVITSWNGLVIAGLASASFNLNNREYLRHAMTAADFIEKTLLLPDGRLLRSWRDGRPGPEGVFEDYAMLTHGLLELNKALRANGDAVRARKYHDRAERTAAKARDLFSDPASGRWFDTREDQQDLFVRACSTHDGAIPSAASVMLNNLITLAHLGLENAAKSWHEQAIFGLLKALSPVLAHAPVGSINSTRALARLLTGPQIASEALAQGRTDAAPRPADAEPFIPVEVYADKDRLAVAADAPASMRVVLQIADGYHVAAADPLPVDHSGETTTSLVPLRVDVRGGKGVAVFADYPKGDLYRPEGAPFGLMAYQGRVEFEIAVERSGEWTGRPLLVMTYQACSDTECLDPRTVELDVAIDPA